MRVLKRFAAALLLLACVAGAHAAKGSAEDEAAIRRIIAEQAVAWDSGDGVAYGKRFVRRDGEWWIEAYHNVDLKPSAAP